MGSDRVIIAKATDPSLRSDAIVVSFKSDWYESLKGRRFDAVIRKRAPTLSRPRWMYFHINAPKSAVCAKSEILAIDKIATSTALEMATNLDMSQKQIHDYLGHDQSVFRYRIDRPVFPDTEIGLNELRRHMVYNPPQSFFVLSMEAQQCLDRVCGF